MRIPPSASIETADGQEARPERSGNQDKDQIDTEDKRKNSFHYKQLLLTAFIFQCHDQADAKKDQ